MTFEIQAQRGPVAAERSRRVTAVLGPTNTGKTHFAIERMLSHSSGVIGLPLRLLAREVYNRAVEKVGPQRVALITGEEKIKPPNPSYWIATVEAMPRDLDVAFVAVDEIQLAANLDRGHVFTDRLLNRRGREETIVIGASTVRPLVERLLPDATIVTRPRLSNLSFAGERKLSRLPPRTAIVAFSAEEVYAIAEFIRRQRGGAAVVLGALSPRTRNSQVEMYQNGDVDFIVATDAIGMGLNLDVDHVAFAGDRKFDGWQNRPLTPAEIGQIAGRAGRHIKDGTFGTTGRCLPFDEDIVEAVVEHRFASLTTLQWRNSDLDFTDIRALQASLDREPAVPGLTRAPLAEDVMVLDIAARDEDVRRQARTKADVARLWEACQVPDYRKLSLSAHAELVLTLFGFIVRAGKISDSWFERHLAAFDRMDGDIDTLSARLAQVRTFNYIANRPDWLGNPEHWQGVTRQVEDNLSDALHERLAHRFVDRRTSVLMRRLRENAMLEAEITSSGDVMVEGQHVGQLQGFRFTPDPQAEGEAQKTLNAAAMKALAGEIESRAKRIGEAVDSAFVLAADGALRWLGEPVARIAASDHILKPIVRVLADEQLTGPSLETVQRRLDLWLGAHIKKLLGPLFELEEGEGLEGLARGIAFQVAEALGVLDRSKVAQDVKALDQAGRGALRKAGLRFGAYHIHLPLLLKPAPRALAAQLWVLKNESGEVPQGLADVVHLASTGRTSLPADQSVPKALYLAAGFRVCGERAVRVDILERLADLIRPAIAYRPGVTPGAPPAGAADGDGFVVTVNMTSLAGCSGEAFASILQSLGYQNETRKGPAITVPLLPEMPREPVKPADASGENSAAAGDEPQSAEASTESVADDASAAVLHDAEPAEVAAHRETADEPAVAAEPAEPSEAAEETGESAESAAPDAEAGPDEQAVEPAAETAVAAAAPDTSEDGPVAVEGETPAIAAESAEEPEIEVWKPHRHQHGGQRQNRERGGRRHQGKKGKEGGESAPKTPRVFVIPPAPERPKRPERPERPAPAEGGQAAAAAPGGEQRPQQRRDGRPDRPRFDGPRPGGRPRHDRNDRGGAELRQFASTEKPRGREKQPDPDSPFAKLLALKAQLEGKDKS